jgi:DNA-binding transcriptional MerR regulator
LRSYEEVGVIGPIPRDPSSRHRRYRDQDLDAPQALACLRAMGVGIEDMRAYQANRELEQAAAGEQARAKSLARALEGVRLGPQFGRPEVGGPRRVHSRLNRTGGPEPS